MLLDGRFWIGDWGAVAGLAEKEDGSTRHDSRTKANEGLRYAVA